MTDCLSHRITKWGFSKLQYHAQRGVVNKNYPFGLSVKQELKILHSGHLRCKAAVGVPDIVFILGLYLSVHIKITGQIPARS